MPIRRVPGQSSILRAVCGSRDLSAIIPLSEPLLPPIFQLDVPFDHDQDHDHDYLSHPGILGIEPSDASIELIQEDILYGDLPDLAELLYAGEIDPVPRPYDRYQSGALGDAFPLKIQQGGEFGR